MSGIRFKLKSQAVIEMRCKYCGKETEREYCPICQEIRDAFQKAKEAEDRLITFRKVMEM